jgi:hypothetical protein
MRLTFFILLLINVALFPIVSGLVPVGSDDSEPLRLSSQLNPERIRILPSGAEVPKPAGIVPVQPVLSEAEPEACSALSGLAREQVDAIGARILELQLAVQVSEAEQTATTSWWVHMSGLQTRQQAERKQAELRALGVREMSLMAEPGDSEKLAISLGLFKTEAAAKDLLASLVTKGVRNARIAPRDGPAGRFRVELRGSAASLAALLDEAPADIAGVERAACP